MALSSQQIEDVISGIGRGGQKGRVMALRRQGTMPTMSGKSDPALTVVRGGDNRAPATAAQRRFLDDILLIEPEPQEKYVHPGDGLPARRMTPTDVPGHQQAAGGTLSDSDRMWLQRLDQSPEYVPFEDARQVLALQRDVTNPSDRRLVDSIANPIRAFHDANAAETELRNALRPLVYIPSSAGQAMADAIAAEVPQLTADEAFARADKHLQQLGATRVQAHADRIEAARARLATLADMAEAKAAPTRYGETTAK